MSEVIQSLPVTAVIPAYNEEDRIRETVSEVLCVVDEVIVVDDGSTDRTVERAEATGATVLSNPANQGYITSIKRAFHAASTPLVVTIDADGEFFAEDVPGLLEPLRRGYADMVQGRRPVVVRPSERILTWLAGLVGPVGDSGTGLRAGRTDLFRELELRGECICGIFSLEVLERGGRISEVPVRLRSVSKPRAVAWYHGKQLFHVLRAMFRLVRARRPT